LPASAPVVRFATESDGDAILALVGRLGHAVPVDAHAFAASFPQVLADHPRSLLHVAEVDGVVAGYALTTITQLLYTNGPQLSCKRLWWMKRSKPGEWEPLWSALSRRRAKTAASPS
jgi:hypothetical protein